jgi:TRAP-type C4-dicarboxylate transport system substrate-binding protein
VFNHTQVSLGGEVAWMMMNKESFAKLPEKGKATIDKYAGAYFTDMMGRVIEASERESIDYTKSKGQNIVALAPEEEARWRRTIAPIADAWVKATPDGANVLAAFREEVAKIRGATPAARN